MIYSMFWLIVLNICLWGANSSHLILTWLLGFSCIIWLITGSCQGVQVAEPVCVVVRVRVSVMFLQKPGRDRLDRGGGRDQDGPYPASLVLPLCKNMTPTLRVR